MHEALHLGGVFKTQIFHEKPLVQRQNANLTICLFSLKIIMPMAKYFKNYEKIYEGANTCPNKCYFV
jgi:hypothetical protein